MKEPEIILESSSDIPIFKIHDDEIFWVEDDFDPETRRVGSVLKRRSLLKEDDRGSTFFGGEGKIADLLVEDDRVFLLSEKGVLSIISFENGSFGSLQDIELCNSKFGENRIIGRNGFFLFCYCRRDFGDEENRSGDKRHCHSFIMLDLLLKEVSVFHNMEHGVHHSILGIAGKGILWIENGKLMRFSPGMESPMLLSHDAESPCAIESDTIYFHDSAGKMRKIKIDGKELFIFPDFPGEIVDFLVEEPWIYYLEKQGNSVEIGKIPTDGGNFSGIYSGFDDFPRPIPFTLDRKNHHFFKEGDGIFLMGETQNEIIITRVSLETGNVGAFSSQPKYESGDELIEKNMQGFLLAENCLFYGILSRKIYDEYERKFLGNKIFRLSLAS